MASNGRTAGRLLQPKHDRTSPNIKEESPSRESKSAKRRCVPTACIPCRKRKSKCDGGMPKCSTCLAVYKTDCSYDPEALETTRRKAGTKRDNASLQEQNTSAEFLIKQIRIAPESEAVDMFYQIRGEANIDAIADGIRKIVGIPYKVDSGGLEGDYSYFAGDPAIQHNLRYGHTSSLGLVQTDNDFNPQKLECSSDMDPNAWTDVTTDESFIKYLLKLYFTWCNPLYPFVNDEDFYHDMASGKTRYCSSLLVNAMCSYACHYTNRPEALKDPTQPKTAGDHFFERARQQLFEEDETSDITTVQALAIMSIREASAGRDSPGFRYAGRSLRMAIELGWHLEGSKQVTEKEDALRKKMFWAIFTFDTVWSACIGRVSQLPRTAVELEMPRDFNSKNEWRACSDDTEQQMGLPQAVWHCDDQQFLLRFSTLSLVVSDMIYMFFAPRERMNSRKFLDKYHKYQTWYKQLPTSLVLSNRSPPHVFVLHMFYWTCIVHLFRPIVKIDLLNSNVKPREVCMEAAIEISTIMSRYRRLFSMRTVHLVTGHFLLTGGTVHLLDLPARGQAPETYTEANQRALKHILETFQDLAVMSENHRYCIRAIEILRKVAESHGLAIPDYEFASESIYENQHVVSSPGPVSFFDSVASTASTFQDNFRTSDEDMHNHRNKTFELHENVSYHNNAGSHHTSPAMISPLPPSSSSFSSLPSTAVSSSTFVSHPLPSSSTTAHSPTSRSSSYLPRPPNMFWTPFEGQSVPLYGQNINMSPMDLSSMLGHVDPWEQFNRDGFRMSQTWGQDPMLGTNGNTHGSVAQPNGVMDAHQQSNVVASMSTTPSGQGPAMGQTNNLTNGSGDGRAYSQHW